MNGYPLPQLLLGFLPSIGFLLLWLVGGLLAWRHRDRGPWRGLAISGFLCLAAWVALETYPSVIVLATGSGNVSSLMPLLDVVDFIRLALRVVGTALVVAAVLIGRRDSRGNVVPAGVDRETPNGGIECSR
ncbi:MAG TPA: hypothetical protein PLA46_00470 [Phycicoccus sp.]|nr:hypothetical protein [Phycicoccus sp.]HQH06337.1 hypothetical protein [Phycicoccus sp.]HQK32538.1 hypothetical protein [Phycicoccus sp.]HQV90022.1 hypothetical protein [Phycicoccus sp.]HQY96632.1 hypothetical protein [Phycicoccus sp.]